VITKTISSKRIADLMTTKLTSAHKQNAVENMPVYRIAGQGKTITIPNNSDGGHVLKFQCCTFRVKHLKIYDAADRIATTNTWFYTCLRTLSRGTEKNSHN
jgi:hypothetical protein